MSWARRGDIVSSRASQQDPQAVVMVVDRLWGNPAAGNGSGIEIGNHLLPGQKKVALNLSRTSTCRSESEAIVMTAVARRDWRRPAAVGLAGCR